MACSRREGKSSLGFSILTRSKIVDSLTSIKFKSVNQNLTSSRQYYTAEMGPACQGGAPALLLGGRWPGLQSVVCRAPSCSATGRSPRGVASFGWGHLLCVIQTVYWDVLSHRGRNLFCQLLCVPLKEQLSQFGKWGCSNFLHNYVSSPAGSIDYREDGLKLSTYICWFISLFNSVSAC